MSDPIVIVGAGQTAAQAVTTLRAKNYSGGIIVLGDEPRLPYQRPPLSKGLLSGAITPERLELKPERFYRELEVDMRLGVRATGIETKHHFVTLENGDPLPYSKLLIATGTRARPLPLAGSDLPGVHLLRTISDVQVLRAELREGARLAVIGGGYIGLEVAASARKLGVTVTVIEAAERVLARVVSEPIAEFLAARHRAEGVEIRTGLGAVAIEGSAACEQVVLTSGERIGADLVLIGVGAIPNSELAAEAGIATNNGIIVDETTACSASDVYAAGDVACFPSQLYARRVRLESVQNAIDQAKAAAAAMLGETVCYDPVPWFWSDQYDLKLQITGLGQDYDHLETVGQPEDGRFSMRLFREGRLIAVESINDPRSHMLARKELAAAISPRAVQA
jgi:3-phenylpropionate/trans-cinnamate dioxygenase ferredoxin reductase subunit